MTVGLEQIAIIEDWESPRWRINSGIYMIVDPAGNLIPFKMNQQQEEFFDAMWYWNLILKGRQQGFSTFAGILALDQCLFNDTFRSGIIAQTMPDCTMLFTNKVERPYLELPEYLRKKVGLVRKNRTELVLGNGSSVKVGMSMRGDTLNLLHVSEFGKICKASPQKAREIVTGAFKTLAVGQILIVESTAEGEGQYKVFCEEAQAREAEGQVLSEMDFRLHFFPWWRKAGNRIDPTNVPISDNFQQYFDEIQTKHGVPQLDAWQKAWYVKTAGILKGDMHREEPSYPDEAFKAHIEGAIYAKEMVWLRQNGRIGMVPWQSMLPVNTFWDFGVSNGNATTIWFHQRNGSADCFIKYMEAEGEGLKYFVDEMNKFGYTWGKHYIPHDGKARIQGAQAETREDILGKLGLRNIEVVPRTPDVDNGIELTKNRFSSVWMDEEGCAGGIKALDHYVRRFDKQKDKFMEPLHNWASNGSDAFRQFGQGYNSMPVATGTKKAKASNWKVA